MKKLTVVLLVLIISLGCKAQQKTLEQQEKEYLMDLSNAFSAENEIDSLAKKRDESDGELTLIRTLLNKKYLHHDSQIHHTTTSYHSHSYNRKRRK